MAAATLKRAAAIFLSAAFFLPLSQCTVEQHDPQTNTVERRTVVNYPSDDKQLTTQTLAVYAAFFWPLALSIASLVWPRPNQKWAVRIVELLLCAGSAYMLFALTYFGALRYGAYIAWGSIALYFGATSTELGARIRKTYSEHDDKSRDALV